MTGPILEARGLRVRYGGHPTLALDELRVERGETLALIGPNGAGKSTLLRVLGLLERPEEGELRLDGRAVNWGGDLLAERRRFASVFQEPHLIDATVARNVGLGLALRGIRRPRRGPPSERWMSRFGIAHLAGRQARTLSGGEAQRASLARAFAIGPDVLLLDEPFSALDPPTREELLRDLQRLLREDPVTTVFVTHDRAEALRLGDRVGLLLAGRLAQVGPPDTVFGRPASAEVARFVGVENLLPGCVAHVADGLLTVDTAGLRLRAPGRFPEGRSVLACLRPEDVELEADRGPVAGDGSVNRFRGRITGMIPVGAGIRVETDCGQPLVALVTRRSAAEQSLTPGAGVTVSVRVSVVHLIETPPSGAS